MIFLKFGGGIHRLARPLFLRRPFREKAGGRDEDCGNGGWRRKGRGIEGCNLGLGKEMSALQYALKRAGGPS